MSSGSVCRLCRQADEKLFLKGARCRTAKCAMEKRSTAPGQHGKRFGAKKLSEYGSGSSVVCLM
jgi:small subunit ribosomal protein S4